MGCSNARLLVQAPLAAEPGAGTMDPSIAGTTPPINVSTDSNNTTTRMHLTGVDLVVERNGSYTLLLTPKTHKQLMPFVLRKKRFRILVDKARSNSTLPSNEPMMESTKELKSHSKKDKKTKQQMESTVESIEQIASDELNKVQTRVIGGRSIDRGNPEDDDENIQSDDEGMIEEIVTTIEEDKDLECKVKKKIETKKTIAQDPQTHNTITKVVKTEVTEITRTITINDQHDLERAKRELGIDDVNRFLPSSRWIDQSRFTHLKEKRYEPINEIVTSKDFPSHSPIKHPEEKPVLAEATLVGRGPVIETISSTPIEQKKAIEIKKKKKKSKLCSCTRPADDEQPKQTSVIIPEQKKKTSVVIPPVQSPLDTQIQGQELISSDIKQLIIDKKFLLIDYIHSNNFSSSKLFPTKEQDLKGRKMSSRILDLLRYDRCSSWRQMSDQLSEEHADQSAIQPMIKTYEDLFTNKQSNLLNTLSTIHHENDIKNIPDNSDYTTVAQTYINERDNQPNIDVIAKQSVENVEDTVEHAQNRIQEENDEKVINDDQPTKEVNMTDGIEQVEPVYNEEQLVKMLADISQHKPITLAEAIAYQFIDIEDPKLGLSNDTIQRINNLFRPLPDETTSNLIRVKRSGEYLTDINLAEINPLEKLNLTEPYIYQLQQTFEPTLDFNEKQFRSLTDAIINNKEQYEQLQFDVARTSLPIYDMKESSTNDFSQSDSGYSMTTATHESLASKIKIEFEPINQDIPVPPKRDDSFDEEKIDLDKASAEQLDKYELNQDLIQIIKSDFNGSDKTIGQAILSRELRLDSTDPNDIARLNSLGIHKEQARILTAFFFPKQTRTIAFSPEPGRFVEAQTTYNPDYPGYKTDTTIIQIQEKQLSSDHLAMQRNIHDDRTSPILSKSIIEPETIVSPPQEILPAVVPKEKTSSPPTTAPTPIIKKRKSSGTGSLLSCFKSKKPKAGTEQQGQATILTTQTSIPQQTTKSIEEKPMVDYAILPDGKRIYIDAFRPRPGLDMSYKPNDFDDRFVLPVSKPESEYQRPLTPELRLESDIPAVQSEIVEHEPPPITIERKIITSPTTIEPIDVKPEPAPVVVPLTKSTEITTTKKLASDLHGAVVTLPEVKLVTPGPLPTISITKEKKTVKVKKSSGAGLCASCFGRKAGEKKKKEVNSESIKAPIEKKKSIQEEEKKEDLPPTTIITTSTIESSILPSTTNDAPILPRVNIDQFRERNFQKNTENLPKPEDRLDATIEKLTPPTEPPHQLQTTATIESSPLPATTIDSSIFSRVNIDQFRERTYEKSTESFPKQETRAEVTVEETHYQLPTKESSPLVSPTNETSAFSRVNIDQFKERTFQKSNENLPKPEERIEGTTEEPHYQLPNGEPVPQSLSTAATIELPTKTAVEQSSILSTTNETSAFSRVNIDQFKERTFQKSNENLPKPEERVEGTTEEPHYQLPNGEPVSPPLSTTATIELPAKTTVEPSPIVSTTNDSSIFSRVNIDQFKERTFPKSTENLPKPQEQIEGTTEEPHYQLPVREPIPQSLSNTSTIESPPSLPTKTTVESPAILSTTKDSSIFSRVNIDQFRERTFQKSSENLPKADARTEVTIEEPHYQLPSGEPVPPSLEHEYSTPEHNTYDIPRSTDLQQTTPTGEIKKLINNEQMIPSTVDIQKSSGDFRPTEIDIKETTSKGSKKISTKKKKSKESKQKTSLFSTFFRHSERKSKIPALDLPPIEDDLSPNNQLRQPHRHQSDPLRIPNTDLPKPDLPLPTYDRPEVNMKTGQVKQSSEFSIPIVDLPAIPNLDLPGNDHQFIDSNTDHMKIPHVKLPGLNFKHENSKLPQIEFKKVKEEKLTEISKVPTIETGLALASPVDDLLSIQIDHKNFPIETDYAVKIESITQDHKDIVTQPELISTEQKYTITDTHFVQPPELTLAIDKQKTENLESPSKIPDLNFQLPSPELILTVPKDSTSSPPSFDDDVPTVPSTKLPTSPIKSIEKQPIESHTAIKKKSSTLALCSCFGDKSKLPKEKTQTIAVPKSSLPAIEMPIPSSNISSTFKTKGPLRAPSNDLPPVNLTPTPTEKIHLPSIHTQDKKRLVINETDLPPTNIKTKKEAQKQQEAVPLPISSPVVEKQPVEEIKVKSATSASATPEIKAIQTESKKFPSFEIKAPVMNIPEIDLSGPPKSDAYISLTKQEETISIPPEPIQSRSDSGLEAIISSHIQPSSTFGTNTTIGDIQQHPSASSGFGSEMLDSFTSKSYTFNEIRVQETVGSKRENNLASHDFARKITMNDETRAKLIFRQNELNKCLENEISKSIDDFDPKKDQKSLNKILTHAIDLIKDKKVTTYPELKQKLIVEHKNDAFIVDPVVRSLYCAIEKQGLDNLDKPEFPLAIRDMVRLPAKQTYDTVTHLNKETASLSTIQMTKETSPISGVSSTTEVSPTIEKKSSNQATTPIAAARSCLTCGRSKSKTKLPQASTTINTGLLGERQRLQLNTHRHELSNILRDHIQSSQPSIRKFPEHTKESEKIIRKSLTILPQPNTLSYEQIRNDLKTEYKQTFYLVDPIVDIIRDTFDHCDITQLNEKTNLDILDSNISQTANLYNNQTNILTSEESNALKSNQLSWLQEYLMNNESKEKKLTRKQNKELNKILRRSLDILSSNAISTSDELTSQLHREYPKAHDLSNRSVELIKQAQKNGFFLLQQAPVQDKRRASSLITDRAKQNLKTNRAKIILSLKNLLMNYNKTLYDENQIDKCLTKTFSYLEEQKVGQFKSYNDLKVQLKNDFKNNHDKLIDQVVDVVEQAHAINQFDDIDKPEVQTLIKDRLDGKPLVIKEMYVSLPPRVGAYGTSKYSNDESERYLSTATNGDQTLNNSSVLHRVGRGLSWREANERARILFYRGKHPAIHYDEQAAGFDVRMLLETASGGTQEIPVTESDVHELLNSCGVQWDGVNLISLVDHSEDVVRAAEQAALKVIREKGIVELRTPPSTRNVDIHYDNLDESAASSS